MDIQAEFREWVLDKAVRAGKFSASRKERYRRMYNRDARGTVALIDRLEAVTPTREVEAGLPPGWFPELARKAAGGQPTLGTDDGAGLPESWFGELTARPQSEREHRRSRVTVARAGD
jgi:hypothetical protein